jgi:transposase
MEAVAIVRKGMVLMTKAVLLEEPCAEQLACTVLQTSGGSDPSAEFNRSLRGAVLWRKVSFGTQSARGSRFVASILTVLLSCQQQHRTALAYLTACCQAFYANRPVPSLVP